MRFVGITAGHGLRTFSICTDDVSQNSTSVVRKISVQYSLTKFVSLRKGPCSGERLKEMYTMEDNVETREAYFV